DHASIAEASSKIIIPIMPSPIDLKAAMRLWMKLSNSGWLDDPNIEIGVVANRIKNNSKYVQTLNAFIEKIGLPHITTLRDTQNYIRSLDAGLTLFDMPPNRVADDLIQWQPLMEWTGFFDIEDDELLELFGAQGDVQPGADQMVSYEDMQAEQLAEEGLGFEQY
ncbi:hypothetical protein N8793_06805, partial [Pseudomonadales bacterium]|nr:hypothetical protein [Pseudomonadales bacterium]